MSIIINMLQSGDEEMIALGARLALEEGEGFCKQHLMYKEYKSSGLGYIQKNLDKNIFNKHRHLYSYKNSHIVCNGIFIFYVDSTYYPKIMETIYVNNKTKF